MADRRIIELSHSVMDGLVTYPGLPAPVVCDFWSRDEHDFHIGRIDMVANTGTYLDAPFHRYADGADIAALEPRTFAELEGVVVHAAGRVIDAAAFDGLDVAGCAVLVHTGWSRHFGTEAYFEGHPFLTEAAAVHLRDVGATLVGIDSLNIDDNRGPTRPVHEILLRAGIPIVEHLRGLDELPESGFSFSAAPARFVGMGSFPVRAYAVVAA